MTRWEHRYLGQERFPDALSTMEVEYPSAWKKASLQPSGDGGGC
jgi:hypothetical protein